MNFNKISGIAEEPPRADKSALAAIITSPPERVRALRVAVPIHDTPGISLMFIIGGWRDTSAPTGVRIILLKVIKKMQYILELNYT
jgi:hypothetical protein